MSEAIVAGLAAAFLLGTYLGARLFYRLRCWARGRHLWSFFSSVGETMECKDCGLVQPLEPVDNRSWRGDA